MEITEDFLKELEDLSKLRRMTPSKLALYFKITTDEFLQLLADNDKVKTAYERGKLLWEIKHERVIDKFSDQGSGPAQSLMNKIHNDAELQKLRDHYK